MLNNKKKNNKKLVVGLFILFVCLLSLTIYTSFSVVWYAHVIEIKSFTAIYDKDSGIVVNDENVVFNDKNQVVKYNVVLENIKDYDVKISDIKLSTPTEEFLDYKVEGISEDDVVSANSTKELTVSFETMRIDGWGRNFVDELTANIFFEKVVKQEEVTTPEEDKEEEKQPEAPAANTEELTSKANKIEVTSITEKDMELTGDIALEDGNKVDAWIYPDAKYIGNHEVEVKEDTKKIVGIVETLKNEEVATGEYNLALVSEENVTLGYISIYINEDKEVLKEKTQDSSSNEETPKDEDTNTEEETGNKDDSSSANKPSPDNKDESTKDDEENKVENPYTSDKKLVGILGIATCITGVAIIIVSKNKLTKYTVFVLMLSPAFTITNALNINEVSIKNNVSFESQNVMDVSYKWVEKCYEDCWEDCEDRVGWDDPCDTYCYDDCYEEEEYQYFWKYRHKIKNIYFRSEIIEIDEFEYEYDVTEAQNGRVKAYLVTNKDNSNYFDLYLIGDGIIYPNQNIEDYFNMSYLESINNLENFDTSNLTDMSYMFYSAGYNSPTFTLDLSDLDTSNVTNMSHMFSATGYNSNTLNLDLSGLDTSNVTDMSNMFSATGYNSNTLNLDLSGLDTSNVTNMSGMFRNTGSKSKNFILDVSNFDTSNVTTMDSMFSGTGYNSDTLTLDLNRIDTSNVKNMNYMFYNTGYNSTNFTLVVNNFDTSKVTSMYGMFYNAGYNSENLIFDVSNFDTSNVTSMSHMFYNTGYSSTNFTLDVSGFDTSKVESMYGMFYNTGYNSTNFTLDVSNFDTSKVTDMGYMFYSTGYSNPNFTLDVSGFDTSEVAEMSAMFYQTGYNSTKLNTQITISTSDMWVMDYCEENDEGIEECMIEDASYLSMFTKVATKGNSKIKVNYTSEAEKHIDNMISTKSTNSNVVKGNLIVDVDNLSIGDEIHISGEKFNVISQNDDTITMLAQYNLSSDYKQSTTSQTTTFANGTGWEYTPGPKEIDIQTWSPNVKTYVNSYVDYLKNELDSESVTGDLITLNELKGLGCTINEEYAYSSTAGYTCLNSPYKLWLVNNQNWWTRSAHSKYSQIIWLVSYDGNFNVYSYGGNSGVRPVITISKETLKNLG